LQSEKKNQKNAKWKQRPENRPNKSGQFFIPYSQFFG